MLVFNLILKCFVSREIALRVHSLNTFALSLNTLSAPGRRAVLQIQKCCNFCTDALLNQLPGFKDLIRSERIATLGEVSFERRLLKIDLAFLIYNMFGLLAVNPRELFTLCSPFAVSAINL